MRLIKMLAILLLGLVSATCAYLLSSILIGYILIRNFCCGDYPLGWYQNIYYVIALAVFIIIIYFFWPEKKTTTT
jgi:riboflavin transporter FmnP